MLPQWEVWTGGAHTEAVLSGKIAVHTSKVQLKLVLLYKAAVLPTSTEEGTVLCSEAE